jgi:hypothetical protein
MRPTTKNTKTVDGFSKKSETKKMLNTLIGLAIVVIVALIVVLVLKGLQII